MLAGSASHLATCPDLGPECNKTPPPVPYYHHVALFLGEVVLDASYGITPFLSAELRFPLRLAKTTPTYSELDGTPKLVPNDIHHHDETLVGPADPWLMGRIFGVTGPLTSAARFGVSLPVGSTVPDPYVLASQGLWHEHIQFGSGTFDPIVGLALALDVKPMTLSLSWTGLFSLYENDDGYRAPTRFFTSARATVSVLKDALRPYVAVDMPIQTEEYWSGRIGGEGPTARLDLLAGGGLGVRFLERWEAQLGVRARLAQVTRAAGFDYPGVLQLGIATRIDVTGKDKMKP